jgi:YesN/AraC family two-component response regulator
MRALVVDDHRLARKFARELLLEDCGFSEVEEEASAIEALALLGEKPFDLALVDISMPGMDGLAMIEVARERLPDQAFIVVSGLEEPEYARRALELGATFVPKGRPPEELIDAVRRKLAARR